MTWDLGVRRSHLAIEGQVWATPQCQICWQDFGGEASLSSRRSWELHGPKEYAGLFH